MKIYFSEPQHYSKFNNIILKSLQNHNIDHNKVFPDLEIYIGLNPTYDDYLKNPQNYNVNFINNIKRPHFTYETLNPLTRPKIIRPLLEEPQLQDMNYNIYLESQIHTILHEMGHYLHMKYLNLNMDSNWLKWSKLINKKLDFQLTIGNNNYPHKISHEDFAKSVSLMIWQDNIDFKLKQFYFGLWGQKLVEEKMSERIIELWIGKSEAKVNGKVVKLDVPPQIINNRTMIPLRFVSESLGYEVEWISEEQKIIIK